MTIVSNRKSIGRWWSCKLEFRVNDNEVTFNILKSIKQQSEIHVVSTEDVKTKKGEGRVIWCEKVSLLN